MYDYTETNIEMPFFKSLIQTKDDNVSYYYNEEKVEVIKWHKPTSKDKIKRFLGVKSFIYADIRTSKGIEKVRKIDLVQKIKYKPRQFYNENI